MNRQTTDERRLDRTMRISELLWAGAFFILVLLSGLSYPIAHFGQEAITLFDVYLVAYVLIRGITVGFRSGGGAWKQLGAVWLIYLLYLITSVARIAEPFSALLWLKQLEHLVFLFCLVDYLETDALPLTRKLQMILVVIILVVVYQLAYLNDLVPGIGHTYRLGLPFMSGVSPNPAGFFLSATILFLLGAGLWRPQLVVPSLVLLPVAVLALVATDSRTNILALLIVLAAGVYALVWRSRFRWQLTAVIMALLGVFFFAVLPRLQFSGGLQRIVLILQNPAGILEDRSFSTRIEKLWPMGVAGWLHSPVSVFVGRGLGYFDVVDGTVPRLLGEQGLLGFLLFAYVWLVHFVLYERRAPVVLLLLLAAINGITVETLIVSYRAIQLYLVVLILAVYASRLPVWNRLRSANE